MIALVVTINVQPGKGPELEAVFKDLAAKVRANEPGNSLYQLVKSRKEEDAYKVLEIYADQAALDGPGQSAHFKEISPRMGPLLAGRPQVEVLDTV